MIPVGYKFGPDWASMTVEQRAERLKDFDERTAYAHAKTKRTCCICEKKLVKGQKYRQANGSSWLGHSSCVDQYCPEPKASPVTFKVKPSHSDLEQAERDGFIRALKYFHNIQDPDGTITKALEAAIDYQKR
jgi:hypothetical protein